MSASNFEANKVLSGRKVQTRPSLDLRVLLARLGLLVPTLSSLALQGRRASKACKASKVPQARIRSLLDLRVLLAPRGLRGPIRLSLDLRDRQVLRGRLVLLARIRWFLARQVPQVPRERSGVLARAHPPQGWVLSATGI